MKKAKGTDLVLQHLLNHTADRWPRQSESLRLIPTTLVCAAVDADPSGVWSSRIQGAVIIMQQEVRKNENDGADTVVWVYIRNSVQHHKYDPLRHNNGKSTPFANTHCVVQKQLWKKEELMQVAAKGGDDEQRADKIDFLEFGMLPCLT